MAQLESTKLELEAIRDDRIFAVKVNALKRKLADGRDKTSALKDQRKIIEGRYKYIDVEDELTEKQRQDNESTLKTALTNRATTIKQRGNPATEAVLLTPGNKIQHYQDFIAALD